MQIVYGRGRVFLALEPVRRDRQRAERVPDAEGEAEQAERRRDPAKERCTRGRESVIPKPVESSAIETRREDGEQREREQCDRVAVDRREQEDADAAAAADPVDEPDPVRLPGRAPRRDPQMGVVVRVGERPRRQRTSSQTASAMITSPIVTSALCSTSGGR